MIVNNTKKILDKNQGSLKFKIWAAIKHIFKGLRDPGKPLGATERDLIRLNPLKIIYSISTFNIQKI